MKVPNADLNLSKAFVTQFAPGKAIRKLRANSPLQVKSMLGRRAKRAIFQVGLFKQANVSVLCRSIGNLLMIRRRICFS
jgi:hypothetical protein